MQALCLIQLRSKGFTNLLNGAGLLPNASCVADVSEPIGDFVHLEEAAACKIVHAQVSEGGKTTLVTCTRLVEKQRRNRCAPYASRDLPIRVAIAESLRPVPGPVILGALGLMSPAIWFSARQQAHVSTKFHAVCCPSLLVSCRTTECAAEH